MSACHVPFARLTGDPVEEQAIERLVAYDRLALTGPIGCGKSSVARYALRGSQERLAPIWINVATEEHERISTVRGFLEILVSQLLSRARSASRFDDAARLELLGRAQLGEPLGRQETRLRATLGGSLWLLRGNVAREITRAVDHGDAYRATDDVRDAAREVIASIAGQDLVPVLVAGDTDRLLRVAGDDDMHERLFQGFFGDVVREIADNLECALLLAAHDRYLARSGYDAMTDGLIRHVAIPALREPEPLGQVISARAEFIDGSGTWQDLLTREALAALSALHLGDHQRSLRRTLTVLREALSFAASDGSGLVGRGHVDAAAAS